MVDVASLVVAIDSTQAATARAALNQLVSQGTATVAALNNITTASKPAANALSQVTTQAGLAQHELVNLGRQGADVFVSLASGQSPLLVLIQQGAQIQDIFTSTKASFSSILTQIRGMLSPTILLAGAFVALGAGVYAAYTSWSTFALKLDDTRRIMGVTSGEAAKLQAAASFKGIDSGEFADTMQRVAASTREVQKGIGGAAEVFRANNIQVRTLNDYLDAAANLVQRAKGDTQAQFAIMGQLGIPKTLEWVRLLESGAAGLKKATDEASAFGGAANDKMIESARRFDEAWNRVWTNFGLSARNAVVEVSDFFSNSPIGKFLLNAATTNNPIFMATRAAYNALSSSGAAPNGGWPVATPLTPGGSLGAGTGAPVNKDDVQKLLGLEQQRIGILGQLATALDANRQVEIAIITARLAGVKISEKEEAQLRANAEASALGTQQIKLQTASQLIETEALSMGTAQAVAYKTVQEKLSEARIIGKTLTDENVAALTREAGALGAAALAAKERSAQLDANFAASQLGRTGPDQQVAATLKGIYGPDYQAQLDSALAGQLRLNAAMGDMKQLGESAMSGLIRDLRDGKNAGEAFRNVLTKLQDKLIDIASNQIMSSLFGKNGQGIISNIFAGTNHTGYAPGDSMGMRMVNPMAFLGAPRFHSGVGPDERAAVIRKDESVLTPGQMRALGGRMAGGGGPININVNNRASNDASATAETRQNPDGSVDIEIAIERIVNKTIARGGADKALKRHGASPVLTRR